MPLDGVIMDSITCKEKRKYHLKFQEKGSAQMQEHVFSREGVCTDAGTCVSHTRLIGCYVLSVINHIPCVGS